MGLATAAPAASLSSFLGTLWRNLPQNVFGSFLQVESLTHLTTESTPTQTICDLWPKNEIKSASKHVGNHTMDRLDNAKPVHAGNQANPFFRAQKQPNRGKKTHRDCTMCLRMCFFTLPVIAMLSSYLMPHLMCKREQRLKELTNMERPKVLSLPPVTGVTS